MRFSRNSVFELNDVSYDQPVHIPLPELLAEFEAPRSLAECMPSASETLRMALLEAQPAHDPPSVPEEPLNCEVTENQEMTFENTFSTVTTVRPSSAISVETVLPDATFLSTPQHALLNLMAHPEILQSQSPVDQDVAGPRLLGLQRGITNSIVWGESGPLLAQPSAAQRPTSVQSSMSRPPSGMKKESKRLSSGARQPASPLQRPTAAAIKRLSRQRDLHEVRTYSLSGVQPGTYRYEVGQEGEDIFARFEMVLNADGTCKYSETTGGSSLKSVSSSVPWRAENGQLFLGSGRQGNYGFTLREARGVRSIERRVAEVRIQTALLRRCSYECFAQQLAPFTDHIPISSSQRVFGAIDPLSPILRGMKCRPDRLPLHAFQYELRQHGLDCDELLSDFRFIDRDEDGQVSVVDMRQLETFGNPTAPPEVVHELREALLQHYHGSLQHAFEALCAASGGANRVTAAQFEAFFVKEASTATPAPSSPSRRSVEMSNAKRDVQKLKEWVNRTSPEERAAVFASLNVQGSGSIDAQDFLALGIHTAVLALRRVEHFQSWIFEEFGKTKEAFKQLYFAMDTDKKNALTRRLFVDGAQALGYPCGPPAVRSVFSLLDRNFDGEVSVRDFQRLIDFNVEQFLISIEALKRFVEERFGGVDEAFKKFLAREQAQQAPGSVPAKSVSYSSFEKACTQVGFKKIAPDADLRML